MTQPPNTRGDVKHGLETNDRGVGMTTYAEMITETMDRAIDRGNKLRELRLLNAEILDLLCEALEYAHEEMPMKIRLNTLKARAKVLGVEVG